jgi:hypothetical protein
MKTGSGSESGYRETRSIISGFASIVGLGTEESITWSGICSESGTGGPFAAGQEGKELNLCLLAWDLDLAFELKK